MKENSPPANFPPTAGPAGSGLVPWRNSWRWLISLLLLWHLLGVIVPPLSAITDASPFTAGLITLVRPYMAGLYLDHGYAFFAPQPGPLHLVRYKVEFEDGREPIEATFPNLKTEFPRLLYHRYFMLAETLTAAYTPATPPARPLPPASDDPNRLAIYAEQNSNYTQQLSLWQMRRSQYEQLRLSLIAHLEHEHPGGKVTLTRVRHRLLSPPEVLLEGKQLNDPATYIDLLEVEEVLPAEVLP